MPRLNTLRGCVSGGKIAGADLAPFEAFAAREFADSDGSKPFHGTRDFLEGINMTDENLAQNSEESPTSIAESAMRRRKMLQIGGASLIATASSRPVWAGGAVCSDSALTSANLSGDDSYIGCGISAGWWKQVKSQWAIPESTPFVDVFGAISYRKNGELKPLYQDGETIGSVISANDGPGNIGKHTVAAYLNALQFPSSNPNGGFRYTPGQVLDMYAALNGLGKSSVQSTALLFEQANNDYDSSTEKPFSI